MPDTMEHYEPPEEPAPPPMATYDDETGDTGASPPAPVYSAEDARDWGAPRAYSAEDVKDWGAPEERKSYHPDDIRDWGIPTEVTSGPIGSAIRQGVQAVVPGIAGGVAGLAASVPGAALGTVAAPGVGTVAGGLATGIPAGMAANYGARAVQNWLLEKSGFRKGTGFLSEAQQYADVTRNPLSSFGGQLVGGAAPTFGLGAAPMVAQRVFGAGLQAGMEGAHQAYQGEGYDPAKIGMAGVAGAAFAKPRGWTEPVTSRMPGAGRSPMFPDEQGGWSPLGGGPRGGGGGGGGPAPGRGPRNGGGPLEGEVLPPEPGALGYENTGYHTKAIRNGFEQRDQHPQGSTMWKAWNDYATELQGRDENKGWVDVDASQGPHSRDNAFTYRHSDAANDITTAASGVAHVNRPVEVTGAGNPYGAPMQARIAAKPNEPARDYGKDTVTPAPGVATQETTKVSTKTIPDDIAAAMPGAKPPATQAGEQVIPPGMQARPTANPTGLAEAGREMGMPTRPPVQAPAQQTAVREPVSPVPPVRMESPASKGQVAPVQPAPTARPRVTAPLTEDPRIAANNARIAELEARLTAPVSKTGVVLEEEAELGRQATVAEMRAANARMTPEQIVEDYRQSGDGTYAQALKDIAADVKDSKDPAMQAAHAIARSKAGQGPRDISREARTAPTGATPHETDMVNRAFATLAARGIDPSAITNDPKWASASPREQAVIATKAMTAILSKSGTATAAGGAKDKIRMPTPRATTSTGKVASSKAEAARRQGVIDAHEQAYAENKPPGGQETTQQTIKRAERIVARARELDKGVRYLAFEKTPGMQMVAAAKKLLRSRGEKGVQVFRQSEAMAPSVTKAETAPAGANAPVYHPDMARDAGFTDREIERLRPDQQQKVLVGYKFLQGELRPVTKDVLATWQQAAKENPNDKFIQQQVQAIQRIIDRTGGVTAPETESGAKLEQQTKRIEADIELNKRFIPDAAVEEKVSTAAEGRDTGRLPYPEFDNSDGGESKIYVQQHGALTNWLNGLPDEAHDFLLAEHPDLRTNVAATQDPQELLNNLQDDLGIAFHVVPGEDAPVTRKTEVKTAAQVKAAERKPAVKAAPAAAEKLYAGTVLDRNSPEFKAAAAAAMASLQTKPVTVSKEAALAAADEKLAQAELVRAEKGTFERVTDFFDDVRSNEEGWWEVPDWMLNPTNAVKHTVKSFWWPGYNEPTRQYADQLGAKFVRLTNRKTQYRGQLRKNALEARDPETKTSKLSPVEHTRLRQAIELGTIDQLPTDLHAYYDKHIRRMREDYDKFYDHYKRLAEEFRVTGWMELPDRVSNGKGFYNFLPRIQKGTQKWDRSDEYDPYADPTKERNIDAWGGEGEASLHQFAGTTQKRGYFTLVNLVSGARTVFIPGEGFIRFMRNGAPNRLNITREMGNFNPNQVGATVTLKKGGVDTPYIVDHAGIDEIRQAMGKDKDGNWNVEYHDNPLLTLSNGLMGLQSALENLKLYQEIVTSPDFQSHLKRGLSKKEAKELKYAQTSLPQFKNMWMPERWAWIMNDFMNPSISQSWNEHDGKRAVQKLDAFSSFFTKGIVVWAPFVQAFNEADKFFVGRGAKWLSPKDTKILGQTFARAVKSVREQDDLQREIIEAGGNPMVMHTLTHGVMEQIAKASGTEVPKNLSKLDPIARVFGVSTKEVATRTYDVVSAPMWWMSDILYTQRYLEARADGLNPEAAAKSVHDFVDSYQVPPTILGSRFLKKVLSTPILSMFNPYHYGLLRGFATILRNLTRPDASYKERAVAAGQAAAMVAAMTLIYPALSAGYASITGNPASKVDERGMVRVAGLARDVATGEKEPQSLGQIVYTPSVPFAAGWELYGNKNWRGKAIVETQNLLDPENAANFVLQLTEYLVGQAVPPYKVASNAWKQPGADASTIAQKVVEQLIVGGINTPSVAQVKREVTRVKRQIQDEKKRSRRPEGMIEYYGGKAVKGYEEGGLVTAMETGGVIPVSRR